MIYPNGQSAQSVTHEQTDIQIETTFHLLPSATVVAER